MRIHYMALSLLLFMGCYEDNSQSDDPDYRYVKPKIRQGVGPTIMFMGDSRAELGGAWDDMPNTVINVGVKGTTAYGIMLRLGYVMYYNPDYVVIFTGVNDAKKFSPAIFNENLSIVINLIAARDTKIILMDITIMPSCLADPDYANEFAPYRNAMHETGYYYPIEYDDSDFNDEYHLSESGYKKVSDYIDSLINH